MAESKVKSALSREQRQQVFVASLNAFMQDLTAQTGFTIMATITQTKEGPSFGTSRAILEVVPVEGWEPSSQESESS